MTNVAEWLRRNTLCRAGLHCSPSRRVQKYDGGRRSLLCRYCRLVVGRASCVEPKTGKATEGIWQEQLAAYRRATESS